MASVSVQERGREWAPCDLVSLGNALRVCDLDLVLLDGSGPRADVRSRVQDGALSCTVTSGFRTRGRFVLPVDWCLIGFVHEAAGSRNWCHGTMLAGNTAVCALPEGACEFAFDIGVELTLLLLPVQRFQAVHSALSLSATPVSGRAMGPFFANGHCGDLLREGYERMRDLLRSDAPLDGQDIDQLLEQHVQAALSVGNIDRLGCSRGQRAHYLALQRAEAYMRLHMRRDIYMEEICEAVGVSERALRYAFKHLLGISPNRYLSMLRLCAACRGLSSADSDKRSVKSVALSCGLWDLSRFADNYRKVFGELPSDTLQRAPAHLTGSG